MSASALSGVSPKEVRTRIAEYRRLGWERRAPAQVVYQDKQVFCPWPDCGYRIAGIHFCLDKWVELAQLDQYLHLWWSGPGLTGKCPGCGHLVLFGVEGKKMVQDSIAFSSTVLPDDWTAKAVVVTASNDHSSNGIAK